MKRIIIDARLSEKAHAALKAEAETHGRTMSAHVREVLHDRYLPDLLRAKAKNLPPQRPTKQKP